MTPIATQIAVGATEPPHGVIGTDGEVIDFVESVAVVELPEPSLLLQSTAALVTLGLYSSRKRTRGAAAWLAQNLRGLLARLVGRHHRSKTLAGDSGVGR